MPDSKMKFTYFGDGKDLEKELVKLEKKHDDLRNSISQVSKRSKKASQTSITGLVSMGKKALGAAAAYAAIKTAVNAVTAAQIKLNASINETIPKLDEVELKLQIQAGLTPKQIEGKIPQIKQALLETPTTDLPGAFEIQTQLVSSGFKQEDIDSGAALRTSLELKAATNQFGESMGDVKESIGAVAQFIKATGSETNAANIRKIGGNLTQLFEGSDIQFKDLSPLAGEASTLTNKGLSTDIQLAAFSTLRDVKNAPEAATGLRQVVSRLSSASQSSKKVKALESIGLKPGDVDLIGEELPVALKRLKAGIDAADEKTGQNALFQLFGEKGEGPGTTLVSKLDVIEKRLGILQGGAFDRNVELFQKSRFADRQRVNVQKQFAEREITKNNFGLTFQDTRDIVEAKFAQDVAKGGSVEDRLKATAESVFDTVILTIGEQTGQTPQTSFGTSQQIKNQVKSFFGFEPDNRLPSDFIPSSGLLNQNEAPAFHINDVPVVPDVNKLNDELKGNKEATERNNQLLEKQISILENQGNSRPAQQVNRKSQGE